jgi:hypothetical protein
MPCVLPPRSMQHALDKKGRPVSGSPFRNISKQAYFAVALATSRLMPGPMVELIETFFI